MNDIDNSADFDIFDDLVESLDINKELALKFFLVFSWFEHVLKELGYHNEQDGIVKINWMKFGNDLNEQFKPDNDEMLRKAVDYLLAETPRNQRVKGGKIEWEDVGPRDGLSELAIILFWVTTVRNNFFHGGKFPKFRIRDARLMMCCLVILDECIHLQGDFQYVYGEQVRGG